MDEMTEKQILLLAYAPLFLFLTWLPMWHIVANAVRHWDDVKSGTPVVQCDSDLL